MAIMHLPNSILTQPCEYWKEYDRLRLGVPAALLRFSGDGSQTWPEFSTIARHPDNRLAYWDQRLTVYRDTARLVATFWTHDFRAQQDIDIHIAWATADRREWSVPIPTGLPGQHCQLLALESDRLLAIYAQRRDPPDIALAISDDFGRIWDHSHDLMVYDSTAGSEVGAGRQRSQIDLWRRDMEVWRFDHPRAILLPDDEFFIVFYAGDDEAKSARWARV